MRGARGQSEREGVAVMRIAATPRRGLRRDDAALYVGVSTTKFDEMVSDGRMPKPKRMDGCVVWDIRRLDAAFDAIGDAGEAEEVNPWG